MAGFVRQALLKGDTSYLANCPYQVKHYTHGKTTDTRLRPRARRARAFRYCLNAQHFESAALSTESGGRCWILRCAWRNAATVPSSASGGECRRRGCPRSERYLHSGAKRSASGALRRAAEQRSLRSPSARAHSEAAMTK